jgi:hypothetical protein
MFGRLASSARGARAAALIIAAICAHPAAAQFAYTVEFLYPPNQTPPSTRSYQNSTTNYIAADPNENAAFEYDTVSGSFPTTRPAQFTMAALSATIVPSALSRNFSASLSSNPFTIEVTITDSTTNESGTIDIGTTGTGSFGVSPPNFNISTFSDGTNPAYAITGARSWLITSRATALF